jgi:uncharacterized protein YjbI with pentapeptide repeats
MSTSANEFLELYKNGRRDFSNLLINKGRFEICDENAISKPIVLNGIKCMNTVFDSIIFNNVKISNSNLSGSIFENPNFSHSYFENVEACVSTINNGRMYCTKVSGLNLRYSNILGFEIELCTIKPPGLTFGNMDLTNIRFCERILTNYGLNNIKIEEGTNISENQLNLLRDLNVNVEKATVISKDEVLAIRRFDIKNGKLSNYS